MTRQNLSDEERLNHLHVSLSEEERVNPASFTERKANLFRQLFRIKKKMGILTLDERHEYIGTLMENALYMKSGERDLYSAKHQYEGILRLEPRNPEANYRYAFLQYKDGNWVNAIHHFDKAIHDRNPDFPLSPDQVIKAQLFIGYCSVVLAKESGRESPLICHEGIGEVC